METVFGIDLGTSNIQVAAWSNGSSRCIVGLGGSCPPLVMFGPNGPAVGGNAAVRAQLHPENAVSRWKWLLGRLANSRAARRAATLAGLNLVSGESGEACVVAAGAVRSPIDLASYALRHAVDAATRACGETPADIVLAVPAIFDLGQRAALKTASTRANLAIERFVRDTTAIGLAELDVGTSGLVAIVDAGASKAEVALVDVSPTTLEVLGRRSDSHTGADDLDARICEWLLGEIEQGTGDSLEEDTRVSEFLRQEVAVARRTAGASLGTALGVRTPFLEGIDGRGLDTTWEVPRARFAGFAAEAVERIAGLCSLALSDAGAGPGDVKRVILTGGLGRVAEVRARVESFWQCACLVASEGAVARGAALYGAALRGRIPLRVIHEEPIAEPAGSSASNLPPPSDPPRGSIPSVHHSVVAAPEHAPQREEPLREPVSSMPSAPISNRPSVVARLAIARSGPFRGVFTASDLHGLPLARTPTAAEMNPPALPLVLLYFGTLKDLTGTLIFKHGEETAPVLLYRGTPTMGPSERARAQRAFTWKDGDYSFVPSTDIAPSMSRKREPVAAFILSGMRPTLRAMLDADVSLALANNIGKSPVVPPDRQPRVERLGLTETEHRLVTHQFDGSRSLAEMFDGNPLGRQTLARLVLVLDTFAAIEWRQPIPPVGEDPRDVLTRRLERMHDQNHFDVVGVHWSVNLGEINDAYGKFKALYAPGTEFARAAPELCRSILECGAAAYSVLSSDSLRLRYRKAAYPEIDSDLLAPLLASRANALAMKGEMTEANDMHRLLNEVSPKDALTLQGQLRNPGVPIRGGAPKGDK